MSVLVKNSGYQWIGDIPAEWGVTKLKFLLETGKEGMKVGPFGSELSNSDIVDEGVWVYNQRLVLDNNFISNDTYVTIEKAKELAGFQVKEKDILITTRGTIGKVAIVPKGAKPGILHPCIIKFRVNNDVILPKLLKIIFNESNIFMSQLQFLSNSTTIDVIYSYSLKELVIPLIPFNEQILIADYLDDKCGKLDGIIADLERQIGILEEFFASTLEECILCNEKTKIKYVADFYNGDRSERYPSGDEIIDEGIPFLNSENIHGVILDEPHRFISLEKYNSLSGAKIIKDDIIYCLRGSVGNCSINKSLNEGTVASSLTVIRSTHINPDFLNYVLKSEFIKHQLSMYQNGSCAANLSAENVGNFIIPFPTEKEQLEIVNKLNKKYSIVNEYISKKEEQLSYLKNYKASLIYEYVTGKKRVKVGE